MPGVIDTLTGGYATVNRQLWIILIPILLDALLWLGPQISLAPVLSSAVAAVDVPAEFGNESARTAEQVRRSILDAMGDFNVLTLLSGPTLISVPSLIVALGGRGAFSFVDDASTAVGLVVGALVGGTLLGSLYRGAIAQQVREGRAAPSRLVNEALAGWGRVFGLMMVLLGVMLLFGIPLSVVIGSAALISRDLLSLGLLLVSTVSLAVGLYLAFALDAIFVSQVGPLQAIRNSVAVVRTSFWPTVLLLSLVVLILLGMGRVWELLASQASWGTPVGIVGNAYIATGLAAASMAFYRDRINRLESPARPAPGGSTLNE